MTRLAVLLLIAASSLAQARPAPLRSDAQIASSKRRPGARPVFDLEQALAMARRYAAAHGVKLGEAYLQGAVFEASRRDWVFDWLVPNARASDGIGYTIITVHEDGEIVINTASASIATDTAKRARP